MKKYYINWNISLSDRGFITTIGSIDVMWLEFSEITLMRMESLKRERESKL
jgi:hypothetical protein